mmetsp:Transcript_79385/g.230479  ORF Transcript_79385/g.230479 Transcript_79385/m.230479 type:complete len:459 (-) Transcript_79385:73-1449(-)
MALLRSVLELAAAAVQGPAELLLLLLDELLDIVRVGLQGRECAAQRLDHSVDELVEEARRRPQDLPTVPHRAPQHPPQHVAAALVGGGCAVGEGDGQRADVVRDHAVCHVAVVGILVTHLACVLLVGARHLLDCLEDRLEDIGVVVAALVQQDRRDAFQAHAGVDALGRKGDEAAVLLALELHEDVVPNLEDVGVVHVHQLRHLATADSVIVELGAGAARAGVAHLPEVVLHVPGEDPLRGQVLLPELLRLQVGRHARLLRVAAVVGGVDARRVQVVHLREQLPRPLDGLGLEVVPEGPVAKHLKEGVVVHVLADVLQVVVLAARTDALLRVGGALELREGVGRVDLPHEDGLELVHASVDEEQGWVVVGHHGRRGHEGVLLLLKELDERAANLLRRRELAAARADLAAGGRLAAGWCRRGGRRWEVAFLLADQGVGEGRHRLRADLLQVLHARCHRC